MQIHTHIEKLPRMSCACVHDCSCLFTSDNSCPAYAALPARAVTVHLGEWLCHFLSSVHRTSVITQARARLFYRTLYEGRSDDCAALFSVFLGFLSVSLPVTPHLFPLPFLFSRSLTPSLSDSQPLFPGVLSPVLTYTFRFQSRDRVGK